MLFSKCVPFVTAAALSFGVSFSASAHYNDCYNADWDVTADAGTYSPVVLGDNIDLNACSSDFFNYYQQSQSYSLCDLSDLNDFSLQWYLWDSDSKNWTALTSSYSGSNVADGLEVSVATGAGTVFSGVGTYYIGLAVAVANYSYTLLPGGGSGYSSGGYGNSDFDYSSVSMQAGSSNNPPSSVPEPAAAVLLLPAIAMVARRERRRRKLARNARAKA